MNSLIIAPTYNSKKQDATKVFQPGARAFAHHYGGTPHFFDNRPQSMRVRFQETLDLVARQQQKIDTFAAFSHGWFSGTQWGLTLEDSQEFIRALAAQSSEKLMVLLFACSTGEDKKEIGHPALHLGTPGAGDGSIADILRDGLRGLGLDATVIAHTTVGHAFYNPYVRVFDGRQDNHGGIWKIDPHGDHFPEWDVAMHHTNMWMRMPWLTTEQIEAELDS